MSSVGRFPSSGCTSEDNDVVMGVESVEAPSVSACITQKDECFTTIVGKGVMAEGDCINFAMEHIASDQLDLVVKLGSSARDSRSMAGMNFRLGSSSKHAVEYSLS